MHHNHHPHLSHVRDLIRTGAMHWATQQQISGDRMEARGATAIDATTIAVERRVSLTTGEAYYRCSTVGADESWCYFDFAPNHGEAEARDGFNADPPAPTIDEEADALDARHGDPSDAKDVAEAIDRIVARLEPALEAIGGRIDCFSTALETLKGDVAKAHARIGAAIDQVHLISDRLDKLEALAKRVDEERDGAAAVWKMAAADIGTLQGRVDKLEAHNIRAAGAETARIETP
jgi:hypothetical protein